MQREKSISFISGELGTERNTVKKWRSRWESGYEALTMFEQGESGKGVSDRQLLEQMLKLLEDKPRSGAPKIITLAQEEQIVALACEAPEDYGIMMTQWNREMLAHVAIIQGIVDSISPRYVSNILKKKKLQPHKSRYWLFPKIENWETFVIRVELLCALILQAINMELSNTHLISVDEKTSIQALERKEYQPADKTKPRRIEYEYTRHGTICLMAGIDVATGQVITHTLNPTRTEEDFLAFIQQTVNALPADDEVIFIADQLNTHKSESLVYMDCTANWI